MQVYKCTRCGADGKHHEMFHLSIVNFPLDISPYTYGTIPPMNRFEQALLCEQCYQTIKEVLEDGEIK